VPEAESPKVSSGPSATSSAKSTFVKDHKQAIGQYERGLYSRELFTGV
jgi:hypothetical protein